MVAELCNRLRDADLSIRAMSVIDTADIGTMRIILDEWERAQEVLREAAVAYILVPVLCLEIPDSPGAFAAIAQTMANAGVNIEYVYATALPGNAKSLGVFRVNDIDTALKLEYPD